MKVTNNRQCPQFFGLACASHPHDYLTLGLRALPTCFELTHPPSSLIDHEMVGSAQEPRKMASITQTGEIRSQDDDSHQPTADVPCCATIQRIVELMPRLIQSRLFWA